MRIVTFTACALLCGMGALALAAATAMGGCSSKSTPQNTTTTGGSCATNPGGYPPANCDDTGESDCVAPSPACPTDPCNASGSACLAMADNKGAATQDFRIRKLNITAPRVLVGPPTPSFIQKGVVDQGINLKNKCGEGGDGAFNWLVRFDTTKKQLTTGGGPPVDDPFSTGYCFTNMPANGLQVSAATVNITQQPDGTWKSDVIDKLDVPIFVHGNLNNVVVLPISKAIVKDVTISPDHNCIGSYNAQAVTSPDPKGACVDHDPSGCQRWHTAGSLGGYITLKEADQVLVADLNESLCVVLTGGSSVVVPDDKKQTKFCGNDAFNVGDYCSATQSDCRSPALHGDSFWLAATLAASAVKINDGSSTPQCNGSMSGGGDAGTDAGDAGDAGHD